MPHDEQQFGNNMTNLHFPVDRYEIRHRIGHHDVDGENRVKPVTMWKMLQRLATRHARVLGVSLESLEDSRYTWVLSSFRMVIYDYPLLNDPVRLMTWPTGYDRLHAGRAFRVTADGGPLVAAAESDWLVIDVKTRRPMRIEPFISATDVPGSAEFVRVPRIGVPDVPVFGDAFDVTESDIDGNEHVNNVRYVLWVLNAMPEEATSSRRLREMTVNYVSESVLGDTLAAGCGPCNNGTSGEYYHVVRRIGDNRDIARAHTRWE